MIRVVVALPPEELERLDALAARLALARSSLIRLAIIKYLEPPKPA